MSTRLLTALSALCFAGAGLAFTPTAAAFEAISEPVELTTPICPNANLECTGNCDYGTCKSSNGCTCIIGGRGCKCYQD